MGMSFCIQVYVERYQHYLSYRFHLELNETK